MLMRIQVKYDKIVQSLSYLTSVLSKKRDHLIHYYKQMYTVNNIA